MDRFLFLRGKLKKWKIKRKLKKKSNLKEK
jgi:hypothetical protein